MPKTTKANLLWVLAFALISAVFVTSIWPSIGPASTESPPRVIVSGLITRAPAPVADEKSACEDFRPYQKGVASWYGEQFEGHPMANGEPYDMFAMTIAHRKLPLDSYACILNTENGKSVMVKVTDRGHFDKYGRIVDLSKRVAIVLGLKDKGLGVVKIYI